MASRKVGKGIAVMVSVIILLGAAINIAGPTVRDDTQAIPVALSAAISPPINNYTIRAPIRINNNAEFTPQNGVSAGDGSQGSPYIIENWDINGSGYGYCIYVGNTTMHFIVRNCSPHHASGGTASPYYYNRGIILYNVQNGTLDNNNASSNNIAGIYIHYSTGNTIANNTLSFNNIYGISLYNASNNYIDKNTISGSIESGLFLDSNSNGNVIRQNVMTTVVDIFQSTGNMILNNSITNSNVGIVLDQSGNNTVSYNEVSSSQCGICLENSNRTRSFIATYNTQPNVISQNNILNNNWGLRAETVIGNIICQNNFINNTNQAYDNTGTNIWDNGFPSGGNYWSDYTGIDVKSGPLQDQPGSDGIGDTPYTNIQGGAGAKDNYPRMSPFQASPANATFYKIPVTIGWNLISIPLFPISTVLSNVLTDRDVDTTWDRIQWYDTSNTANHWKQYNTGWSASLNDLWIVNQTMGVWINIITVSDSFLNVSGTIANSTSIPLHTGWNMVGYPSLCTNMTVANALWGTGATMVEVFDAAATYKTKVVGPTYIMKPGEGYWVYVPADTIWTVDW